ncbi:MAG: hydroxymethylglutaryl-CoA lyase [Acidobacteriota bacterium]|nr:hydroxymethylglutaryl-CoA lyase [Acidobacteriota bacterium]
MTKNIAIKLVECPRDAWQGMARQIPTQTKVECLQAMLAAGIKHIDAVSFVSPQLLPQMADSEDVLKQLDLPEDVEIIATVLDQKGAERAAATKAVHTLNFSYSVSETYLKQNLKQSAEENSEALEAVLAKAQEHGLEMVASIAMAFGNPHGEDWSVDEVKAAVANLADMGIRTIILEDNAGVATPERIGEVFSAVIGAFDHLEIGVHLHTNSREAGKKIIAAYDAGCHRFTTVLGGLGGSLPTEIVVHKLVPIAERTQFVQALQINKKIAAQFGA